MMTPRQKQGILALAADAHGNYYYNGALDGKWGPKSQAAAERFLKDFIGEENKVPEAGSFWDDIEFFNKNEFECQCYRTNSPRLCNGFPVEPEEKMVRAVDEIRRRLGVPVSIVNSGGSGVRCPRHNANIPGAAKQSYHLTGQAADLHSSKSPEEMARVAEEVIGDTGGIGIYSWGIHVDTRGTKARWRG